MHLISNVLEVFVYCSIVDCGNHKTDLMRWERAVMIYVCEWHFWRRHGARTHVLCTVLSTSKFFCCCNCAFKLLSFLFSQDQEPTAYNHVPTVVSWGKMETSVDKDTRNIQELGSLAVYETQRPTSRLHTQWIISGRKRPSGGADDNFVATFRDVTLLSCHPCSGGLVRDASVLKSPTLL